MPFTAPIFLLGAASGTIPVIIHMIHKRKAQRVPFPTIRFLKASNERTSRRQKIQDLLLLLLRVLLLVLLSVALAQPFLGGRGLGIGPRIDAVILLDNSYSMTTQHEGTPRFKVAKELALVVVDALPEGSQAAVLLAAPPHGHPEPVLLSQREAVRKLILAARPSQARADLTAAVHRAGTLLEDSKAPTLEIYAITDLQKNSWQPPSQAEEPARRPDARTPNLVVVDCGREDYRNLAVTELLVRGGARVRDRPVAIQARIHNYSPKQAAANVTLYVDRAKQSNQQHRIDGNLTATASFHHVFHQPGIHSGWVQIGDDSLALDNRRDFSIDIQDHIPAILFRHAEADLPQLDPAFFINKALDPYGDDPGKTRSLVQTTATDYGQITHERLRGHKVALLVDPSTFTVSQTAVLRRYVRRGGRLIVFCGPGIRPNTLNRFLNADEPVNALMPLTIHPPDQGLVDRKNFKSLIQIDYDHPALAIFKGFRLPQTAKVYNYAPVEVDQNSPVRILIGLSDGNPFLLENHFDKGRILLFTTTTDPDWSNLAAARFFLPLVHRLVYYLTERSDVEGTHIVGKDVQLALRDVGHAVLIEVTDPDGGVHELKAAPVRGVAQAVFRGTDKRGPYAYLIRDPKTPADTTAAEAKAAAKRGFVVNIDAAESDLTKIPARELAGLLKGQSVYFAAGADDLRATIERMREGVPLRNLILFIVLFIAIFECFFANRIVPALQRAEETRPIPPSSAAPSPAEA